MQRDAGVPDDANAKLERSTERTSIEGRALELAVSAIEALRERGSLTGSDLCRLAALHGFDEPEIVRAWRTRAEFDLTRKPYALDAPIARVLPLL
ncbi:MAG: hypothetical protein IAI49_14870 [Candidatus Eremiobacteraeota bacterium]|nr:hypothetical protein [Candidatus Eremiobacteraeota bacterium]